MKDKKTTLIIHPCQDKEGMERYLEKMAAKGWMLEKMENIFWHFKKCEPKKVKFSVVYVPKASELEGEPTEEQRSFQDFCEYAGWEIIKGTGKIQVFCTEKEDVVPIDTDPELELEAIHKVGRLLRWSLFWIVLFDVVLQLGLSAFEIMMDSMLVLSKNVALFLIMGRIIELAFSCLGLFDYYKWYFKAKKELATMGEFSYPKKAINYSFIATFIMYILITLIPLKITNDFRLAILGLLSIVFAVVILKIIFVCLNHMRNKNTAPNVVVRNIILIGIALFAIYFGIYGFLFVNYMRILDNEKQPAFMHNHEGLKERFYDHELPLTIQDLLGQDDEVYSYKINKSSESILLGYIEAEQDSCMKSDNSYSMEYSVTKVKALFLYDMCKKRLFKEIEEMWDEDVCYEKMDATSWKAKEAYNCSWHGEKIPTYILCYDNIIVKIDLFEELELTDAQKATIAEKLGGIQ